MIISVVLAQDPPVTLVLDDFHLLTDSAVLDGLDYVLRNTGAGLRLVVRGAAPAAEARVPRPDGRAAPASGPVV